MNMSILSNEYLQGGKKVRMRCSVAGTTLKAEQIFIQLLFQKDSEIIS